MKELQLEKLYKMWLRTLSDDELHSEGKAVQNYIDDEDEKLISLGTLGRDGFRTKSDEEA